MVSGCLAKVVFSDAKHNFLIHYLAAVILLLAAPIVFGFSGLDERMAAIPLEIISPVIGMVLMTPVFMPEQNENIYDVVKSKKLSHTLVCFMRIILAAILTIAIVGVLALYMRSCDSQVTARLFAGTIGSALALGALGTFCAAVGDNAVIGYMVSISYIVMDLFMRTKLKKFDLFTFTDGGTKVNLWLYAAAAVLVISALIWRKYRK